ncbi:MAG: TlyA family RNA methyltransferase [Chthonomonadales bacterium]
MSTERLDVVVVSRGLASSRTRAQGLIKAGLVTVNGEVESRTNTPVEPEAAIEVTGVALPYVGKGGLKMEAALKTFRINVRGTRCLDVGASTGGFTDCLLQRGAASIVAIDVGHSQISPSLLEDPRVESREGVNARNLKPEDFDGLFDLAAIDVSFISLTLVLPAVAPLICEGGHIIALVKPEFEVGRAKVGARGIVRDTDARKGALKKITEFSHHELGLEVRGTAASPYTGGNREYIICLRRKPTEGEPDSAEPVVELAGEA